MRSQPPHPIAAQFRDIGVLGREAGWDLGFKQLEPGPQRIPVRLLSGGRVTLLRMQFNRAYHQRGTPPPGTVTFGVPFSGMRDWFTRPYEKDSVLNFNHTGGVDGVNGTDFEAVTVSIEERFLHEVGDDLDLLPPDRLLAPETGVFLPNSRAVQTFRRTIEALVNGDPSRFGTEWETELAGQLLEAAVDESSGEDKSTPATRAYAVSALLELIADRPSESISVAEVCRNTGVSWRTLDRAFKERFGIGPKAYMMRERLAAVRVELLASRERTIIADVANKHGFWHMGQFAADYRRLFGELPSQTRRQSKSDPVLPNAPQRSADQL